MSVIVWSGKTRFDVTSNPMWELIYNRDVGWQLWGVEELIAPKAGHQFRVEIDGQVIVDSRQSLKESLSEDADGYDATDNTG